MVNCIGDIHFPNGCRFSNDIWSWTMPLAVFLTIFNIFIFSTYEEQLCFWFRVSPTIILGPYHRIATVDLPQSLISWRSWSQIFLASVLVNFQLYHWSTSRSYCSMSNQSFQDQCRNTNKWSEEYFDLNDCLSSNTGTWHATKTDKICSGWWKDWWHFMDISAHEENESSFEGGTCEDHLTANSPL